VLRGCRNSGEEAAARPVFDLITTLDVDVAAAEMGARFARSHRFILNSDRATADALIAGTAYAHRATLVTLNTRQFSRLRVPGLNLLLIDQQAADWVPVSP
jgi:predicted nucleic acid-binding protein